MPVSGGRTVTFSRPQRGGSASRLRVTATVTAEKGHGRVRIRSARLESIVEGLAGVEPDALAEIARAAEEACTISALLRATVPVTVTVRTATGH